MNAPNYRQVCYRAERGVEQVTWLSKRQASTQLAALALLTGGTGGCAFGLVMLKRYSEKVRRAIKTTDACVFPETDANSRLVDR